MNTSKEELMVTIRCLAYNHEPYIRQCLEGFVMQKTNFRFEAIVHDDASTDGTATIIKEYAEKYPNIIKPILEVENQYSKRDGSIRRIMNEHTHGKYIALCEGDDYWIDSLKLQKQVDFLEKNQDYTMCCSDALIITQNKELNWCRYNNNQEIPTKDIIIGGGLFIQTASLLYNRLLIDARDYPQSAKRCHVGDYPLQIFAALKGKIYWFAEKQVAYRYETNNSWTKNIRSYNIEKLISGWLSEINMLKSMDEYSQYQYTTYFKERQVSYIYDKYITFPEHYIIINENFSEIKKMFSFRQKIILFLIKTKIWHFLKLCKSLILSK